MGRQAVESGYMKTVILAGGRGSRLAEETHAIPKPMVLIGGQPIIWHIMNHYSAHGFNEFIVALGYKGHVIKEYFVNQFMHGCDMEVDLTTGRVNYLSASSRDWKVTLIDTGLETMTGGRLGRLSDLLDERFLVTYGDGLSDVPVAAVLRHHEAHGALATVTAVHPPPRFGALAVSSGKVTHFGEKAADSIDWINGGYFVIEPEVLDLVEGDASVFESDVLPRLAEAGRLAAYQHNGFWMPMDTIRERDELNRIWCEGHAPWAAP